MQTHLHPSIHVFAPIPSWGFGHAETCYQICSPWPGMGLKTTIHTVASNRPDPMHVLAPVLPRFLPYSIKGKFLGVPFLHKAAIAQAERNMLSNIREGDICYFWPGAPEEVILKAKDRGGLILIELINTHIGYARDILHAECDLVGMPRYDSYTDESIQQENFRLSLADLIFSPGPFVTPSIKAFNCTDASIMETSYGAPYPKSLPPRNKNGRLTFLFVGLISIRKGVHRLLDAWASANIDADLVLAGSIEPTLIDHPGLSLPNVHRAGYVRDIASLYTQADVFIFPSLEEGGPQVVYEAASYGLPLVVTPMGGGRIAKDGRNALIVPHADTEALATAIEKIASNIALREELGKNARQDAVQFDWAQVARQRQELLSGHIV